MKKTITKPDGSTEVVEGSPEEIAEYERKIRGETQNESPKPASPGLLTDEVKRMLDGFAYSATPLQHAPECQIVTAQRGWWCVDPPRCTCGLLMYPSRVSFETISSSNEINVKAPHKFSQERVVFPGCMGRPNS